MSHGNQRKENNCLNCNARVFGPYCHVCGQQNVEPKETAVDLIVHFFNDITHFEGKFITSLRYLFFRPGHLTSEYILGRRASYMNPVRMYVFASAFFFILYFSVFSDKQVELVKINETQDSVKKPQPVFNPLMLKKEVLKEATDAEDSAVIEKLFGKDTVKRIPLTEFSKKKGPGTIAGMTGNKFKTIAAYDSAQDRLPAGKRDNQLERMIKKRLIFIDEKYDGDLQKFNKALFDYVIHSIPKVLFISLPLFAFFLFLLYIRRKKFYYVTHVIFVIHFYVFVFLALLLYFSNGKLQEKTGWNLTLVSAILWMYMFIYLYKAMRRVYEQPRAKTMLKYFLLLFALLFLFSILFIGLFSYSFFNM